MSEMSRGRNLEREAPVESKNEQVRTFEKREYQQLLVEGRKLNEGNNGVVVRLPDSPFLNELLREMDPDFDSEQKIVSKLLKIYTQGSAEKEFDMQRAANQVLAKRVKAEQGAHAFVPKAYFHSTLDVESELADVLGERYNISRKSGDKLEVILMDEVPGEDLATHMYREALRIAIEQGNQRVADLQNFSPEELKSMSINELSDYVQRALQLEVPQGADLVDPTRQRAIAQRNAEKLKKHLGHLPTLKPIFAKLQVTMKALHDEGIYHRDLHERNIMIDGEGDDLQVALIDFGAAAKIAKGQDPYAGKDADYLRDETLWTVYADLMSSEDEKVEQERQEKLELMHKTVQRLPGGMNRFMREIEEAQQMLNTSSSEKAIVQLGNVQYLVRSADASPALKALAVYKLLEGIEDAKVQREVLDGLADSDALGRAFYNDYKSVLESAARS